MKMNLRRFLVLAGAVALAGCHKQSAPAAEPSQQAAPEPQAAAPAASASALLSPEKAVERAPAVFKARFTTTKGDIVVEAHRDWSPNGADRFYNMVKLGYYKDIPFFRVMSGFMAQFGIHPSAEVNAKWRAARIPDDPAAGQSNTKGMLSFATAGPNTRTTQIFINYGQNGMLDGMGFTPFGKVVEGMEVATRLYSGYGDGPPEGRGPDQGRLQGEGTAFLKTEFPEMDYIKSAKLEE